MLDALDFPAFGRRSALLARLALACALLATLVLGVRLFWLLVGGPVLEPVAPVVLQAPQDSGPAPAQSVANWHLFGTSAAPIDLAVLAQNAPETALKLTLRGTLNEDAPEGGVAIVADESGADQAYKVGDMLPGDARLEGIYAGRVLLSRNGVNESLSLPRADESVAAPASATRTPGAANGSRTGNRAAQGVQNGNASTAPFALPAIAPGTPSLESFRNATGTDPLELAKQVQIFPVIENGRMAGVRLSAGRDSDILSRAGLRPSDVVTAVNGIPLDGPQRQTELLANLRDAQRVQLTVRRDGKELQLAIGL